MMAATTGSSGLPLTLRLLSAALMMCSTSALHAEELAVTAVRYWSLSDVTRIAIETNNPFTFRTDRLHKPERAFFDLKDTRSKLNSKGIYVVGVNDPRVRQIRVAETQKTVTRIVLDLEDGQFDISTSQLSVPDRLIIEVRPSSGELNPRPVLSMTGVRNIPADVAGKVDASSAIIDAPAKRRAPYSPQPLSKFAEPPVIASRTGSIKAPPVPPAEWRMAPRPESGVFVPPVHSKPAGRNSNGDRSLTRALGLKIRRVVLDPGHGGYDHGTTGPGGLTEKELVLDVAKRLGTLLQENLGSEVVFTRNNDTFIPLEERTVVANAKKADLFLSIHANSSPIRTASGVETYYLSTTSSRASLDVAARENAASQMSISDLKDLLQKIVLRDKLDESREFAAKVQDSLIRFSAVANPPKPGTRRDRGVKRAPFVVLIGAQMPAILTEIGFVTNSKEEGLLKKPEYRQKIAEAILAGVQQYAESLSQFEVAQTQKRSGSE
jgi:N-acetylmuramoyl-L-alanine amidase